MADDLDPPRRRRDIDPAIVVAVLVLAVVVGIAIGMAINARRNGTTPQAISFVRDQNGAIEAIVSGMTQAA